MEFDYSKLRGKIKEVFGIQENFSIAMGMSRTSLSQRLNNKVEFSPKEIKKAASLLLVPEEEYFDYFFKEKVQKHEQRKAG